jgi:ATP-dependent Zn protease
VEPNGKVGVDLAQRKHPDQILCADIANICNEAALIAARAKQDKVETQLFIDAMDRIVAGLEKKNKIISAEEKRIIAYHESAHAIVSCNGNLILCIPIMDIAYIKGYNFLV